METTLVVISRMSHRGKSVRDYVQSLLLVSPGHGLTLTSGVISKIRTGGMTEKFWKILYLGRRPV